jgi:hypothetical protein
MAPIHLYLAAWVLGGVLLGTSMLLDARGREARAEGPHAGSALRAGGPAMAVNGLSGVSLARGKLGALLLRIARVTPLGLIGFGLSGLLAKGLELDLWPGTFLIALSVGLGLIALGYRLSAVRSPEPSRPA